MTGKRILSCKTESLVTRRAAHASSDREKLWVTVEAIEQAGQFKLARYHREDVREGDLEDDISPAESGNLLLSCSKFGELQRVDRS
jgi:hypothetical protein